MRGKTPSLIGGSLGKPVIVQTKGASKCTRCKEAISAGTSCAKIPGLRGAFKSPKSYCVGCMRQIIDQTKVDIGKIEQSLE